MSQSFGKTLRQAPADTELASHRLALRAGLVRFVGSGIYTYLPLGWRVVRNVEVVLREEMDALGAQEMLMPVLNPASLWQATGRWDAVGPALVRLTDRSGRDYALAMTHEEVVAELARREVLSYRDLPRIIYHIQTKVRDEARPRGGLLRVREFRMKDAYSLDVDEDGLDEAYNRIVAAYERIFGRCGLEYVRVEADSGMMGGAASDEFMLPHPDGEDTIVQCTSCAYAANMEQATFALAQRPPEPGPKTTLVETPGCRTIADVAKFVGVPTQATLKAVFYAADETGLVFVVIRGDLEINEPKLLNLLAGAGLPVAALRTATDQEIRSVGAEPGYASPVGLSVRRAVHGPGVLVIADRSVGSGSSFVAGANRPGYHLVGVDPRRDFAVTRTSDVAQARDGLPCPQCGAPLATQSAIELGHCFKLGLRYSEVTGATYLDPSGAEHPIIMGSYGIGVGRLIAAAIEVHHDDDGIVWPPALAPYPVHLVRLGTDGSVRAAADEAYAHLRSRGLEALYDDREQSAGVKFADADLIGCPVRVTVSRRSLKNGGVELKARWEPEREIAPVEGVADRAGELLADYAAHGATPASATMRS
jgi:prolyl-tRNA synthetase